MDKPGYYNERHYTTYLNEIKYLKSKSKYSDLENLLLELVNATEAESHAEGYGVAPAYYEELAILYRKQKEYSKEISILERFKKQKQSLGATNEKLFERLEKAKELVTKEKKAIKSEVVVRENDEIQESPELRPAFENEIQIRWINGRKLPKSKGKALYLGSLGDVLKIEEFVLEYYSKTLGYFGYWTENDYWWAIMSLLFWDIIFAKIPGAFLPEPSPLVLDMPYDFFKEDFYIKRKSLIDKRILDLTQPSFLGLKQPNIETELVRSFEKHFRQPCRSMNWEKYSKVDDLFLAIRTLSGSQIISIMERLLSNFNDNRKGLPDLFLAKNDSVIFVEVKEEKEKVADHQYNWHKYIKGSLGVNVEICRVIDKPV
jgi:hypothetical protein